MSKPIAVVTGDVHFTLATLDLATQAVTQVLTKARDLGVPAILNGDTLDTKAVVRAEIANRLIEILTAFKDVSVFINTGNHDLCNEKGTEHALNFLKPYATVVDCPIHWLPNENSPMVSIFPYFSDASALKRDLEALCRPGDLVFLHQGVLSAHMGHYTQDKTSLPQETFANVRVVASHYHRRQDIVCGPVGPNQSGVFTYVGSPYTTSFSEANDGPKGFSVVYSDGTLKHVPTNLRRHVVQELDWTQDPDAMPTRVGDNDLGWLKVKGTREQLEAINKEYLGKMFVGHANYKLDLIPVIQAVEKHLQPTTLTGGELLDSYIDQVGDSPEEGDRLKNLWRGLT